MNKVSFKNHPAYLYAKGVVEEDFPADIYIKKVATDFLNELEKEDSKYFFDYDFVEDIDSLLGLIIVPSGVAAGKKVNEMLAGFQWFFILNALAWKMADDHEKRRYEKSILLIARKSGKTFITAIIFILLLLLEPQYSNFFSVAPTLDLSRLIFDECTKILANSPVLAKRFRVTKTYIESKLNGSKFTPLATGKQTMDGRLANVFLVDEAGALRDNYPIQAMESSQMNIKNRTGILISTAYPTLSNPMTEQVGLVEDILDGKKENDKIFGLIYKPDFPNDWKESDDELLKANPLAVGNPGLMQYLKEKRASAIDLDSERGNFLTKHMNIFINGGIVDTYVTEEDMDGVEVPEGTIDWQGKDVFIGLDLAHSDDNAAVAMVHYDKDSEILLAKTWIFYPSMKEADKLKTEGLNYSEAADKGLAIPSGGMNIDYDQIESFIMDIEENYGVNILGMGYDKYSAPAMAVRLGKEYNMAVINQGTTGTYLAAKFVREKILDSDFHYDEDFMLTANFLNAKKKTKEQMDYILSKKDSSGKIDAVAAIVDATALWLDDITADADGEPEIFIL